jgi:hypothetical protein
MLSIIKSRAETNYIAIFTRGCSSVSSSQSTFVPVPVGATALQHAFSEVPESTPLERQKYSECHLQSREGLPACHPPGEARMH